MTRGGRGGRSDKGRNYCFRTAIFFQNMKVLPRSCTYTPMYWCSPQGIRPCLSCSSPVNNLSLCDGVGKETARTTVQPNSNVGPDRGGWGEGSRGRGEGCGDSWWPAPI